MSGPGGSSGPFRVSSGGREPHLRGAKDHVTSALEAGLASCGGHALERARAQGKGLTMGEAGKALLIVGVLMAIFGVAIWGFSRIGFRGLPGDVRYESQNVRVYFPIVTCLVLSVLLTLGLWAWQWLMRR